MPDTTVTGDAIWIMELSGLTGALEGLPACEAAMRLRALTSLCETLSTDQLLKLAAEAESVEVAGERACEAPAAPSFAFGWPTARTAPKACRPASARTPPARRLAARPVS